MLPLLLLPSIAAIILSIVIVRCYYFYCGHGMLHTIASIASLLLPLQSVLPFFSIARTWLSFDHSCPSSFTHCEDGVVLIIVLALFQIFLVNDCNCYCCPQHEILCLIICLLQHPLIVPQNTDINRMNMKMIMGGAFSC